MLSFGWPLHFQIQDGVCYFLLATPLDSVALLSTLRLNMMLAVMYI